MFNKNKTLWIVLGGILLAAAFYGIYLGWIRHDMTDFGVCYKNGRRILDGETLYRVSDGHLQFKYAPVSALFYAPLALLPWEVAKIIWFYLELILLFAVLWISTKLLPSPPRGPVLVLLPATLVLLKFIGRELELGQVNILILFFLTSMIAEVIRRKDAMAGVLWGISLFFKPYALVFLPYFILKKRFKIVLVGAAVVLAGLVLPALNFGLQGNWVVLRDWISTLSRSTPELMAAGDTSSLYAFLWKVLPGHPDLWIKILWLVTGLTVGLLFLGMMRQGKKQALEVPEVLEMAFLMILIPLFSPLGWFYNYLYSVLAIVLLIQAMPKFPPLWKYALIADLIIIGATLREVLGKDLFHFYTRKSLVVVNYLIVLAALAAARFNRKVGL
ncbi:MAG: glycosyltransferase family 87 protein [Candidatus Aminicenantes bacterium]|nr:glycosyltransferase family 87 protein [Candidatus Aminicenantes bacterium]